MDQYELVRTGYRVYGQNISELSRMTGHSRNTIKKAIRGEPWGYKEREHQPFPVLEPYLSTIDAWIEGDKEQPKKQRHTARRIYHRLIEEHDYSGCESTVRRYVRLAKIKFGIGTSKAFIPCDPEAGYEAEVDWGTVKAIIGGKEARLKFFCMRSKYSGKHFVRCYPCERQQAFFDAHIQGFEFFGGVWSCYEKIDKISNSSELFSFLDASPLNINKKNITSSLMFHLLSEWSKAVRGLITN